MRYKRIIIGLGVGAIVALPAGTLAVMSTGGGHGSYITARLLFPYTMILTRLQADTITAPLIGLALIQFPLYGALIGMSYPRRRSRFAVVSAAALLHIAAAALCFSGLLPEFS